MSDITDALYTFTLLNIADISTTIAGLKRGAYEANPVGRWFLKMFGIKGLFILKYLGMGLSLLAASLFSPDQTETTIWIWNIILSLIVGWNSYINYKLTKKSEQ